MTTRTQRGSRVIYVAASARELPQDVQDWLGQPSVRAAASTDIYDALAQLADGKIPLGLIVSMECVDWDELDFFVHAHRVSPDTLLYVVGADHHESRIEAALARGARRFDPAALSELLAVAPARRSLGPAGLLAGSMRTEIELPASAPRLVPPESAEADAPPPETAEPPPVRLVSSATTAETETPVPFPWSPAPGRPQRTPPSTPASTPPRPEPSRRRASAGRGASGVKLTPEELEALMEPPATPGPKAQEGGS